MPGVNEPLLHVGQMISQLSAEFRRHRQLTETGILADKKAHALWQDEERNPRQLAYAFLAASLGEDPLTLRTKEDFLLDLSQMRKVQSDRQLFYEGLPLAYIRGWQYFYGEKIWLGPGVLIPRPDTETLVEEVLMYLAQSPRPAREPWRILELCSGSGCVSKALLVQAESRGLDPIRITATEVDEAAFAYAKRNLALEVEAGKIEILLCDLFPEKEKREGQAPSQTFEGEEASYDLIVANPPYISEQDYADLELSVRLYEPEVALNDRGDGLLFYRRILKEGRSFLRAGACVFLEHAYDQAEKVRKLEEVDPAFRFIACVQDLAGRDRVTVFQLFETV